MNKAIGRLLAVITLAVLLIPIVAGEQGQITIPRTDSVTVLTLDLKKGEIVDFNWSGNGSVRFRLENLAGSSFVDHTGQTGQGSWGVTSDGTYTFEFRNESDLAVTVQWTINHQAPLPSTIVYLLVALGVGIAGVGIFLALRKRNPST